MVTDPIITDVGTYLYQGTTTGSYANPHAPTKIKDMTVAYDRNGNMTSFPALGSQSTTTNAWDYRNRLTQTLSSTSPTLNYAYDHTEQRVLKGTPTATTTYPSKYYNTGTTTASITKHIFLPDGDLIATITGSGATTTKTFIHTDHLGGTGAITNASGTAQTLISYYPYGSDRVASGTQDQRGYIGGEKETSGNYYLNARYYESNRGQFLSQDPVFWEVGMTKDGKSALQNPQTQNSYSYAEDNPIVKKDPSGRFIPQAIALGALYGGISGVALQAYGDYQSGAGFNLNNYAGAFLSGAATGAAAVINPFLGAGVASGLSLRSSYYENGGSLTAQDGVQAIADGAVTGLTAGYLKGFPQIRGVQASKVFGGNYFTGSHGVRYANEAGFGFSADAFFRGVQGIGFGLVNTGGTSGTGSTSGLPGTVTQNGVTYVRNSSGLLNLAPSSKK